MKTIAENLQRIQDAKADLREAIIDKGGTLADDAKLSEFAEAVEGLPSGGSAFAVDFGEEIYTGNPGFVGIMQEDIDYYNQIQAERAAYAAGAGGRSDAEIQADPEFKKKIAWWPKGMGFPSTQGISEHINLLSYADLSPIIYTTNAFYNCYRLQSLDVNSTNAASLIRFIYNCFGLIDAGLIDVSKATNLSALGLDTLPILRNIRLHGINGSIKINKTNVLTLESVKYILDNCQARADGAAYTLTLHADVKARFMANCDEDASYAEALANATAKGLTIA